MVFSMYLNETHCKNSTGVCSLDLFMSWGQFPQYKKKKHPACRCLWKNEQYVCSHDKSDSVGLIKMLPIMVGEIFPLCI